MDKQTKFPFVSLHGFKNLRHFNSWIDHEVPPNESAVLVVFISSNVLSIWNTDK